MKKSIVAASVASVALAAMPIVGVFAANEASDELTVTVIGGCNVGTSRTKPTAVDFGSIAPGGAAVSRSSAAISITCNDTWTVKPHTTGLTGAGGGTTITSSNNGKGSSFTLAIATSSDTGITNAYDTAKAIDGSSTIAGSAAVTSLNLTPTYVMTIGQQQEPDTYTGTVYYDVASN